MSHLRIPPPGLVSGAAVVETLRIGRQVLAKPQAARVLLASADILRTVARELAGRHLVEELEAPAVLTLRGLQLLVAVLDQAAAWWPAPELDAAARDLCEWTLSQAAAWEDEERKTRR